MAALIFVGGLLRFVVPAGPAPNRTPSPRPAAKSERSLESPGPKGIYAGEIAEKIKESFGCAETADFSNSPDLAHWNVPSSSRTGIHFIIGFVPDPVHTHLALLFDRDVEALEVAVQRSGDYVFDRSILPWEITSHEAAASSQTSAAAKERTEREAYPGLLIFRKSLSTAAQSSDSQTEKKQCPAKDALLVFLIAETPTSGIRTKQFQNALKIMRDIGKNSETAEGPLPDPLLLLGPSFSGSLDSLSRQLQQISGVQEKLRVFAYSGTVSGAESASKFQTGFSRNKKLEVQFASFQESDAYAIQMFERFAYCRGYTPDEIAILSESDTAYGNQAKFISKMNSAQNLGGQHFPACQDPIDDESFKNSADQMVYLRFPREISSFRSAYEKQLAEQTQTAPKIPGKSSLPTQMEEEGSDDDAVAPFANGQTALSQEAVMVGLVNELQKHHIKFTVLLATNPIDQVFLARYLRTNYPQGRVVVTTPDLLFASQEDELLSGVLGLNDYSLVPGLSDSLCKFTSEAEPHADPLFDSSSSVGIYNAMLALLAVSAKPDSAPRPSTPPVVPPAPYADYASPPLSNGSSKQCTAAPVLWLTILSHDGYWPIAALTKLDVTSATRALPVVPISNTLGASSSLPLVSEAALPRDENPLHTRTEWNVIYSICLALLALHAYLSWTGSFLSNSESKAQFSRTHDRLGVIVLALGAFWLSAFFALLMCTRNPLIVWQGSPFLTALLWAPLPVFVVMTTYDIAKFRSQPVIAGVYAALTALMTVFQIALACDWISFLPYTWSNRLYHFSSGVSPIVPFLLLFASGYWWAWFSLRGVSIVDLRRPRLPGMCHLPLVSVRISDAEGEKVRNTAHPLKVGLRIIILLLAIFLVSLTALEVRHPLQSLEGNIYDVGYSLALAITIAVFLGCLMRLVFTWFDYKQVLAGLDRSPLREAFSRMNRLSWRSMWNPGGSTLRETYRVMSRTIENMQSLKHILQDPARTGMPDVLKEIHLTEDKLEDVLNEYHALFPQVCETEEEYEFLGDIQKTHTSLDAAVAEYEPSFPTPTNLKDLLAVSAHKTFGEIKSTQKAFFCDLQKYLAAVGLAKKLHETARKGTGESKSGLQKFWDKLKNIRNIFSPSLTFRNDPQRAREVLRQIGLAHSRLENAMREYKDLLNRGKVQPILPEEEHEALKKIKNAQAKLVAALDRCATLFPSSNTSNARGLILKNLTGALEELQKQMANTAGSVFTKILTLKWGMEQTNAVSKDDRLKKPDLEMPRAIEEEFVALVYVNFLQSVLLQMRTLVVCAGGMYVLLLCSMSVYPFEPHLALQILAVALLVVMAVAVGFVYKEMHRDAILSRLTSTNAGELGWDFWIKFISAGAIPVFSLLAVQFPAIARFLFSWLAPALQALK